MCAQQYTGIATLRGYLRMLPLDCPACVATPYDTHDKACRDIDNGHMRGSCPLMPCMNEKPKRGRLAMSHKHPGHVPGKD